MGTPVFGLERLRVAEPMPVLYVTEEDAPRKVAQRFEQLCIGARLPPPEYLHIAAGKGVDLDVPEHQDGVIEHTKRHGYRIVTLDPVRSLTACADQGPRELKPLTDFLRRFMRETGAALLLVHHDTKPQHVPDNRRRPQRASGGGIPASPTTLLQRIPLMRHTACSRPPRSSSAKTPLRCSSSSNTGYGRPRFTGSESSGTDGTDAALDQRIVAYLEHSPFSFGSSIAKGARARKTDVLVPLQALCRAGKVEPEEEARGTKWMLRKEL